MCRAHQVEGHSSAHQAGSYGQAVVGEVVEPVGCHHRHEAVHSRKWHRVLCTTDTEGINTRSGKHEGWQKRQWQNNAKNWQIARIELLLPLMMMFCQIAEALPLYRPH